MSSSPALPASSASRPAGRREGEKEGCVTHVRAGKPGPKGAGGRVEGTLVWGAGIWAKAREG
jgi:hypothetical protein